VASAATREVADVPARRAGRVASGSFGLVLLLVIQYVLGIAYNLYGTAPTASKKITAFSSPLLAAHVVVGTALVLAAIYLVVAAARARIGPALVLSVIGLLSILAAWASGSAFAQNGDSGLSMTMAVMTAVALLCYAVNVRMLGRRRDG
jgi:hypothetical protein